MDHHQSCVKSNRLGGHTTCVSLSAATRKLLALEVRPRSWRLDLWASDSERDENQAVRQGVEIALPVGLGLMCVQLSGHVAPSSPLPTRRR